MDYGHTHRAGAWTSATVFENIAWNRCDSEIQYLNLTKIQKFKIYELRNKFVNHMRFLKKSLKEKNTF